MDSSDYGSIKIMEFSDNITKEEIVDCSTILAKWASDDKEYAIITYMPEGGKSITDLASINKVLSPIKGAKLKFYGIQNSPIVSFITNVVGQLLGLSVVNAKDYASLLNKIKMDNPDFKADIEQYNLDERIKALT